MSLASLFLEAVGDNDFTFIIDAKIIFTEKSCLAGGISHSDSSLLGRLHITLEVASDSISHCDKVEFDIIKDIAVFSGEFQKLLGETVIVLLLLHSIVECRVAKVFFSVGYQERFQFYNIA